MAKIKEVKLTEEQAKLLKENLQMKKEKKIEVTKPKVMFLLNCFTGNGRRFVKYIKDSDGEIKDFELVESIKEASRTNDLDLIRWVVAQNLSEGLRTDAWISIQ